MSAKEAPAMRRVLSGAGRGGVAAAAPIARAGRTEGELRTVLVLLHSTTAGQKWPFPPTTSTHMGVRVYKFRHWRFRPGISQPYNDLRLTLASTVRVKWWIAFFDLLGFDPYPSYISKTLDFQTLKIKKRNPPRCRPAINPHDSEVGLSKTLKPNGGSTSRTICSEHPPSLVQYAQWHPLLL